MIVVQHIVTSWTKQSRGAPKARLRNTTPEVLPVALLQNPRTLVGNLIHQDTFYRESDDFQQPHYGKVQIEKLDKDFTVGCVTIFLAGDAVHVLYDHNPACGGKPDRGRLLPIEVLVLHQPGQWGQIIYNGRYADDWEGYWYYQKDVVNVGLFSPLDSGVFTRTPPNQRYADLAKLR